MALVLGVHVRIGNEDNLWNSKRERMTTVQQADFDAWMIKTYLACWKPAPQPADADPYVAQVRLAFKPDGSLAKPPKLVNPPSDRR